MSISDFFQKLVETSNSKLSDIVEGDIIWARRYKNEKEKQAIPDGHREGPFIVLSNNGKELVCVMCTGVDYTIDHPTKYMEINYVNYNLRKDTFVRLESTIITSSEFITRLDTLRSHDLNQLYKKYKINNPKSKYEFHYDVGDIVSLNGQLYYIYSNEYSYFKAFCINRTNKSKNVFVNNSNRYSFNFEGISKLNIDSDFELVDIIDEPQRVEMRYSSYLKDKKEKSEVRIGTLVEYENKLYYIYGEYKENFMVYKVCNKGNAVKVAGKNYFISLTEEQIPKKHDYRVVGQSSVLEREDFKRMKTISKKSHKPKTVKAVVRVNKDIVVGSILLDEYTFKKYFVYKRNGNKVTVYNMDDLGDSFVVDLERESKDFRYMGKLSHIDFMSYDIQVKNFSKKDEEKKLVL